MKDWLTIAEFVQQVPYSESQIRRFVDQGKIPSLQPGGKGGKILIPQDALHELLRSNNSVASPSTLSKKLSGRKPGWKS